MDLKLLLKRLEKATIDNSPAILTAIGITGTLATAYLTGKSTIKAIRLLDQEDQPMSPKEVVKKTWTLYIPPATTCVLTIGAIYGANHVSTRRATAMATAYSISERAFNEYRDKVVEKIGENKERAVRDELAQDRVSASDTEDKTVVITDGGEVLCYDQFSGRYFKSSMEAIRSAENEINHRILNEGYACVSDLYELLGLPTTSFSEEVGWNHTKLLHIIYSTVLSKDGKPCIAIDFDLHPNRKFSYFAGE